MKYYAFIDLRYRKEVPININVKVNLVNNRKAIQIIPSSKATTIPHFGESIPKANDPISSLTFACTDSFPSMHPDPSNCKNYIACFNSVPSIETCPTSLLYDHIKETCTDAASARCYGKKMYESSMYADSMVIVLVMRIKLKMHEKHE